MDFGLVGIMDKTSNPELFSAILSSHILVPYLERDPDLAELIKDPKHPDIHYFDNHASAKQLLPILKQRVDVMVSKKIPHNLEATKQLVAFMEAHLDSEIHNVTFNGKTQHYGVRCGRIDNQIHVICVMTGGRIPDQMLRDSIQ